MTDEARMHDSVIRGENDSKIKALASRVPIDVQVKGAVVHWNWISDVNTCLGASWYISRRTLGDLE